MKNKKFCYLIQSPDYIPSFVKHIDNENSDVYVLTFQKPINYKNTIFIPAAKCTWTDGRNALAELFRDKGYLYNIFLDDDVELINNRDNRNPWRVFEEFLLKYEPAVGVAHWKKQPINLSEEVNTVYQYDAIFNAVHKDVMNLYYPLVSRLDEISWWWSQVFAIHTMAVLCPGTVLQCNSIKINNKRKGDYPNIISFGVPSRLFKESLLREEDKQKVIIRNFLKYVENGKYFLPEKKKYKRMVEEARDKVNKDNMLWKNRLFINF